VNPGSDLALALGLIHVILRDGLQDADYVSRYAHGFDELCQLARTYDPVRVAAFTGIAAAEIELLAREYAATKPAAIRLNYGVQRSDRGGSAVRAIAALPVLTGAWRTPGGGAQLTTSGAFQFNIAALERPDLGPPGRVVNMSHLGKALLELNNPPVKALVVYNSNPAAIAPNQAKVTEGLRREDLFTVALEQLQTDTVDFADIVLPVTTFLEHTDLYRAYGHYYLQMARPALDAPGETKTNVEIFRLLAKRMGFRDSCFDDSEDDMIRSLLDSPSEFLTGVTLERLDAERSIELKVAEVTPFATGGFRTNSGKFEFGADSLAYSAPVESRHGDPALLKRFPLELISGKNDDSMNSTFGYRADTDRQTSQLSIHPDDAAQRGIASGSAVKVFNDRGACYFTALINDDIPSGVLRARSLGWRRNAREQLGINHLTSERLTDMGGGPTFYSCLVEVVPA
jgi:anaerobic selenocysteine-containing dehydrogenase